MGIKKDGQWLASLARLASLALCAIVFGSWGCGGAQSFDSSDSNEATSLNEAIATPTIAGIGVSRPGPVGSRKVLAASVPSTLATYGGGPIISPEIVTLYWGSFTQAQRDTNQAFLTGLAAYMHGGTTAAGTEPVTFQYGVYGATLGATYTDTSLPTNNGVSGHTLLSTVGSKIASLQSAGHLPAYGPERLIMVFTNGITFDNEASHVYGGANSATGWCAIHQSAGVSQYYSVNPVPMATGTGLTCGLGGFGGFTDTQVWQTQTSHELFEASTDPDLSRGWTPEIGDQCNWGADSTNMVSLSFGTIQKSVDNLQSSCSTYTTQQFAQTSVASWSANRMDVFSLSSDHSVAQNTFNGSGWSGWQAHGGVFVGPPVATSWGSNELDVFGQTTDFSYYHQHWNGSAWQPSVTDWEYHGGNFNGPPAVASWGANRIDVFGEGTDGACYHQSFSGVWSPSVSTWESLGGTLVGPPAVASWGANRLDIFVLGTDGAYYHKDWNGSQWEPSQSGWDFHGGTFAGPPVVISWGPNILDVFGRAPNGHVLHQHFNGSVWQPSSTTWEDHGGNLVGPVALNSWLPNHLDIFGEGTDNHYYHQQFDGTSWVPSLNAWEDHGGLFQSGPALSTWGPNTLAAFGDDASGVLDLQDWQGFWSPSETAWASLGGSLH